MEIFSVIKLVIGSIFGILGFIGILCGFSPRLLQRIQGKGDAIMTIPTKSNRLFVGVVGFLVLAYFVSDIISQLADSREKSAVYQNQIVVKHRAEQISKELYDLADEYDKGDQSEKMKCNTFFGNKFGYRIDEVVNELANEGIHTNSLDTTYFGAMGMIKDGNQLRQFAGELKNLSDELPK